MRQIGWWRRRRILIVNRVVGIVRRCWTGGGGERVRRRKGVRVRGGRRSRYVFCGLIDVGGCERVMRMLIGRGGRGDGS